MSALDPQTYSGMATLVGRPNVGKSTLVNALVGEKVSIVTPKAQTTRHRIIGVLTRGNTQIALVDTPGLHGRSSDALNRVLNETALASLAGVDVVLFMVAAGQWRAADAAALARLDPIRAPVALVVNKVDQMADKTRLLPFIEKLASKRSFAFVVPVSAARGDNLEALINECAAHMPGGPFLFPEDEYTDRSLRFIAAETVREKLTLFLQQELPYSAAIEIEGFDTSADGVTHIQACIWVARDNHKAIVIGRGGQMLKKIGRAARRELIERLGGRVDLRLWVKLRENWINNEAAVRDLGH